MARQYQINNTVKISEQQHNDLVEYFLKKLDDQKIFHETQIDKYRSLDKQFYGYLKLQEDDKQRESDNQNGFGIKPTDTSIPLVMSQIGDAITFLKEVLSADSGLYAAIAPVDKQRVAKGFSALMNQQADKFRHEKELSKFLIDGMKYNFAAIGVDWAQIIGQKISNVAGGGVDISKQLIYSGNKLQALDMYNLWYDLTIDPIDLMFDGEYFAVSRLISPFRLMKKLKDGQYYNIQDIIDSGIFSIKYYSPRPNLHGSQIAGSAEEDWIRLLGGYQNITESSKAAEIVKFSAWIDLPKYGLVKSSKDNSNIDYAICQFEILNSERICNLQVMNNAHGMLPIGVTMPIEDGFREATKSFGELLLPFQRFASFQFNIHQKAARRALYGITFYNENVFSLSEEYDPVAGKYGISAPPDADLNKSIKQIFDGPNTENTLKDIQSVIELMQKILPTDLLRQVANLQRATEYQAAATVQAGSKKALEIAKIINAQAFSPVKQMQMYNILQYQESMTILDPTGQEVEISPAEFRDANLEFTISSSLKGLDRLSIAMQMKEVLNSILQSQQASQQINVTEVIDYYTSLLGDATDFTQFKFQSQMDALPPQQRDLAFQLLQQFMQQQKAGGQQQGAGAGIPQQSQQIQASFNPASVGQ